MKLILAIKTGFSRSVKSWKGILIFWVVSFFSVSLIVAPLKAGLKSSLGSSMITEKLMKGIDIDVLGDLGVNLHSMYSSLTAGLLILSVVAVLLNIFITGGLFDSVKNGSSGFLSENFFRASAKNFWSYMIIALMLYLIIIALIIIVVVIPVSVVSNSDSAPEGIVFKVLFISVSVFMLAMTLILLAGDYARAWKAVHPGNSGFKAIGFGFSQTFKTFLSSFPLMLIMLVLQGIVTWVMIKIIAGIVPVRGGGVLVLFLISQVIFFLKLFIKVLRYGSVTSLMEQNFYKKAVEQEPSVISFNDAADLNIEFKRESDPII
jgi:hypothetical protein